MLEATSTDIFGVKVKMVPTSFPRRYGLWTLNDR